MNTQEYFEKYNGKGINFDGKYGNQCVDNYRKYVEEVLKFPQSPSVRGAKDIWTTYLQDKFDRLNNDPDAVPQKGDIIIWGSTFGTYGHVAIFDKGDINSFVSFDQNFPTEGHYDDKGNFIGTGVCHFQHHTYDGVLGWLRPKDQILLPPTVEMLPKPSVILDFLTIACTETSDNEINAYVSSNKNLRQIFREVFEGNDRFFNTWIKPQLKNADEKNKLLQDQIDNLTVKYRADLEAKTLSFDSRLETANQRIAELQKERAEEMDWRTLFSIAWKKWWADKKANA